MTIPGLEGRTSGILLHVTSLPSEHGIGDLGPWAFRFADFLAEGAQRLWQVLPLNPTSPVHDNSPYDSISAFGSNPLLISLERLVEQGLLDRKEVESRGGLAPGWVDYDAVIARKEGLFPRVQERFLRRGDLERYEAFCQKNGYWLDEFALFAALKRTMGGRPWAEWPPALRDRDPAALCEARRGLSAQIEREKIEQYLFQEQWSELKIYCNRKGIRLFGDIPMYVNHDSADVWTHPELFKLDEGRRPTAVAGVPPDYFSETGQRWGNPVYRWDVLEETGFDWWVQRLQRNLDLFDIVRIDHFRGFVACWEIPADEPNAVRGRWVPVPGRALFETLLRHYPGLPIVAEDLGIITQEVRDLMNRFGLPGMKLLVFAFGEDVATNPYAPHNHVRDCLVYTGTHDNNTIRGWFERELTDADRDRVCRYLGRQVGPEEIHREMLRLAMMSVASTVILPMQDLLGLDEVARMNRPASSSGNWRWQLLPDQLNEVVALELREMTELYGRA